LFVMGTFYERFCGVFMVYTRGMPPPSYKKVQSRVDNFESDLVFKIKLLMAY